jgi:hypothetical protein
MELDKVLLMNGALSTWHAHETYRTWPILEHCLLHLANSQTSRGVSELGQPRSKVLPFPKKGVAQSPGSASNIDVSASSDEPPAAFQEPELRIAVTRIILYGTYRETKHSAHDRNYRNVSDDDIQAMLQGPWKLAATPEWDAQYRNWKYRLAGSDIEGDELVLIVALNLEESLITVITKF